MRSFPPTDSFDPRVANALTGSSTAPKTLVEAAYRGLRRNIIEGVYAPGEKLRVEHLKNDYNVSGSTLREALAHLVADTLVSVEGQRGFRVAPISVCDFQHITRARVLLETEALHESMMKGDEAWEARVVAAYHQLSRTEEKRTTEREQMINEYEERNQAFHLALISACSSAWIQHFLRILWQQSERYRRLCVLKRPISRDVHREHAAIVEAVLAHKTERAVQLLAKHIHTTFDVVQRILIDSDKASMKKKSRKAKSR
jgi:GntR family transcriptional regulator, carbon starvation induced regulator